MSGPVGIGIAGAGRMGRSILRLATENDGYVIRSVWVRQAGGTPDALPAATPVSDDIDRVAAAADVLIDFSVADATPTVAAAAAKHGIPLVCGVTGLDDRQFSDLEAAAKSVAVVYDRNMSEGITVLNEALRLVAGPLAASFAVRIAEVHHAGKKDAPSGTALKLAETVAAARGSDIPDIPIDAERRGEVPGEHRVVFEAADERLELAHSVTNRDVFATGALRAAAWIRGREPGLYSMRDVLFAAPGEDSRPRAGASSRA